jgi:uncharacterized iron-regulated protein
MRTCWAVMLSLSMVLMVFASGCATARERPSGVRVPQPVIYLGDGTAVEIGVVIDRMMAADAVLIGENHGHGLGLRTAAELWAMVAAKEPKAALAMEFFERDEQAALDDYLAGITDEAGLRAASGRTESNYPPGHRDMVETAKERGLPVIAANAPRRYVRLARLHGFERLRVADGGLTAEQARLVRVPEAMPTGAYRRAFESFMSDGKPAAGAEAEAAKSRVDAMFRSQSVWDWTMGESVARTLATGRRPVVLVVGRFHIDRHEGAAGEDGGTTLALRAMSPGAAVMTITFIDGWPEGGRMRAEDRGRADVVVYVGPGAASDS